MHSAHSSVRPELRSQAFAISPLQNSRIRAPTCLHSLKSLFSIALGCGRSCLLSHGHGLGSGSAGTGLAGQMLMNA
ncbi:hypothetical protein MRB53_038181 [Persea americana]|nr:hypothetical protein MRB53_038181 [Persea americana]